MTRVTYIVGRSVDRRQAVLERDMASRKGARFLQLVPTRGRVMDLEASPLFWPRRRVETLSRVVQRIFEEDARPPDFADRSPADRGVRSLLIRKVLERREGQPDGLAYFSRLMASRGAGGAFPGICRQIAEFFAFLSRNNTLDPYVEDVAGRVIRLEEEAPGTGEARYALETDLTWLLGDYEEIKREARVYDEGDVAAAVRAFLAQGLVPRLLAGTDVIVLDGLVSLSRAEEDILFHLFQRAGEVWWLLDADPGGEDPVADFRAAAGREAQWHRYDKARRTQGEPGRFEACRVFTSLVSLMDRLDEAGLATGMERAVEEPFGNPVAGGFYTHGRLEAQAGGNLRVKSFPDPIGEVRALAAEIKRLVHEDGLDPSRDLGRIRIIFPRLKDYAPLISEVFHGSGIPFSLTRGVPLSFHPMAHIFLNIFDIPLNGFQRQDIVRLFSSGLVRVGPGGTVAPAGAVRRALPRAEEIFALEDLRDLRALVARDLPGGDPAPEPDMAFFDAASRRCGLQGLGHRLSGLWDRHLPRVRDYYRDRWRHARDGAEAEAVLREYLRLVAQVILLERRLRPFADLAAQDSPQGIVTCLFGILEGLGFPRNLVRVPPGLAGLPPAVLRGLLRRDAKAYQAARELAAASAREMEFEGVLFQAERGEALLSRFQAVFRARVEETYLLDERDPNVVRVSEWLEIRGRSFDYVLVGGLTADAFPLREPEGFILPEVPHRMFRMEDPALLSKHLFSHLLRNTRRRLFLSYPRYRAEREALPSPVLVDLAAMVCPEPLVAGRTEALEEVFAWPPNPYVTSDEAWLTRPARNGGADPEGEGSLFNVGGIVCPNPVIEENLIRGINALRSRWASDGLFEHDGLVRDAKKFAAFLEAGPAAFSASQLETLANCPMLYLFRYLFGLRPREELDVELSPRDMGDHIHAMLKAFFERLAKEGTNVADLGLERAYALARETAEAYLDERPFLERLGFFAFQRREFLSGLDQGPAAASGAEGPREGVFAQLLRFEAAACGGALPRGLEYAFGGEGRTPALFGGTEVRGIVDRFDVDREDPETAYVFDYKTGSFPSTRMCKMGLSFQLPVYMRALKDGLGFKKVTAAFYELKRQKLMDGSPLKQRVNEGVEGLRGLDISGVRLIDAFVEALMGQVRAGVFHHSVDEKRCDYCDFAAACYRDARRMKSLLSTCPGVPIYSGERNLRTWKRVESFKKQLKETRDSMSKAFTLKTEAGRARHYEKVTAFRTWLETHRSAIPFEADYLDACLEELEAFEQQYMDIGG